MEAFLSMSNFSRLRVVGSVQCGAERAYCSCVWLKQLYAVLCDVNETKLDISHELKWWQHVDKLVLVCLILGGYFYFFGIMFFKEETMLWTLSCFESCALRRVVLHLSLRLAECLPPSAERFRLSGIFIGRWWWRVDEKVITGAGGPVAYDTTKCLGGASLLQISFE